MEIKADSSIIGNIILLMHYGYWKLIIIYCYLVFDDDVGAEVQEEIDQSESDEDEERQVSISFLLLINNTFTVLFNISKYLYRKSLPMNYFT